ncbi:hypothetical protein [Brevundimonas sp. A19_0]|uniref:hypothetical protein n=1 Tax=Brevundimonas sp. A19_0 TaxID=2821087 RepID=UPI001AD9760E|nr:hypothetical protein [Brevundimonas sp. A19_0]MBO9500833.1 hypothetical protein [Brevundimonas sp. A19_0]
MSLKATGLPRDGPLTVASGIGVNARVRGGISAMQTGPISGRTVGVASTLAVGGASLVYGAVLLIGLAARSSASDPIADPWLVAMEMLILFIAPCMTLVIWSIDARARSVPRGRGRLSVVFMAACATITFGVHLVLLSGPRAAAEAAFRWPSPFYLLDILAWDVFFALAVLLAAPLVRGGGLARLTRWLLVLSGLLALAGLIGVPTGDMNLRNIGILGYAVVFPAAALVLGLIFWRAGESPHLR